MYLEQIRAIVAEHGRLLVDAQTLERDSDLYQAGLTSLSTVNLMLALEEHFDVEFKDSIFDVEFKDSMLGRKTFGTLRALSEAIEELKGPANSLPHSAALPQAAAGAA
jgi:acyl carrier protein